MNEISEDNSFLFLNNLKPYNGTHSIDLDAVTNVSLITGNCKLFLFLSSNRMILKIIGYAFIYMLVTSNIVRNTLDKYNIVNFITNQIPSMDLKQSRTIVVSYPLLIGIVSLSIIMYVIISHCVHVSLRKCRDFIRDF
jgi:hypothetical protein